MPDNVLQDCVLAVVNESVGFESVRAAREVFDAPVACIVMYQYVEEEIGLTPEEAERIGRVYSLPDFYFRHIEEIQALSLAELTDRQEALERKLGIRDNNLKVSHDRQFARVPDFRTSRELQCIQLMLVDKVVRECSPKLCMLGYGIYLCEILADAFGALGVPAMAYYVDRFTNKRQVAVSPGGRFYGMEEAFNALMQGREGEFDPETLAEADARYEAFVSAPSKPSFAYYRARSTFRVARRALVDGPKSLLESHRRYTSFEYDRVCGRLDSPLASLARWPQKGCRMLRLEYGDVFVKSPRLDCPYFYLPLHFSPEVTDMYYGSGYDHHAGFVKQLAKRIPSGYRLYVKEHPSMLGLRPLNFYRELKTLHNVEIIHPAASPFELIREGVTIVVTGTAGWEAYLMQRPVVVLGNVFFNFLPGVHRADLYDPGFMEGVQQYLDGFDPDEKERRMAMRAGFLCSVPVGEDVEIVNRDSLAAHAVQYTRARKRLYELWGSRVLEDNAGYRNRDVGGE